MSILSHSSQVFRPIIAKLLYPSYSGAYTRKGRKVRLKINVKGHGKDQPKKVRRHVNMNYAGQRVRFFPLPKVPCALRQSPSTTYSYLGLRSPGRSYLTQLFNKCFRSAQYKTRTGCTKGTRYEMRTRDYGLSIKHGLGIHSP